MTETGVVALVGVLATLISGLGAAWLTNRSSRQRDIDQRMSLMQAEIRGLIVNTLVAARGWAGAVAGISTALAGATSKEQFQSQLTDLLTNSKPGKDFDLYGPELHTRLTEARLRIADGALADSVDEMNTVMLSWWDEVITPMREDLTSEHPSLFDRVQLSSQYVKRYSAALRTLEETARVELPHLGRVSPRGRVH